MKFIKPRWRKVLRDLWSNKSRTVLVVLSIAVGIFAIGVVSGSQGVLIRDLNGSYAATNPASGTVFTGDTFGDKVVEVVESMRDVELAQGVSDVSVRFKLKPDDEWRDMQLRAYQDYDTIKIAKFNPEQGRPEPSDKTLVLERTALDWMGAAVGDTIIVKPTATKAKERLMTIVGTVHSQDQAPAVISGQATAFITRNTLEWLGEDRNYSQLDFIVAEDKMNEAHIAAVGEKIRKKIESDDLVVVFVNVSEPGRHPVDSVLQPLLYLLNGLGWLALILSGFLVVNTISALMAQQTRQIGIMKSIGATRRQIMVLYFVTVLLYGTLALLVAIPLGAAGAYGFTLMMAGFFNFDVAGFGIPLSVILTQAAIGLCIPLVVSIYPIMSGTGITVREAISDYGVGKGRFGSSIIDRLLQRIRGLSRPMMISLRNTFRRKARLALTLLTLTLAGAIFITIFSVRDSLMLTLDDALAYWNYHIGIRFEQEYRMEEINRVALQVPGVTAAESWGFNSVRRLRPDGSESDNILMIAPPAATSMLQPKLLDGRWLKAGDQNAVVINTDFLKNEEGVEVGDTIVLKFGRRETTWQVVGLVQGILAGPFVYADYTYFARTARDVGSAGGVQILTNTDDVAAQLEVSQALQKAFQTVGLKVTQINTIADLRERIAFQFNFLVSFLLVMAVVLAVVGGLGLTGTMSINVLERVREIGVMRAIGASDFAVLKLVIVEGMLIGLLSWGVGALVAFPLSQFLSNQVGMQLFQAPLSFAFSVSGVIIWLIIAVVLAGLASFLPARGASRLTVREVLAYE